MLNIRAAAFFAEPGIFREEALFLAADLLAAAGKPAVPSRRGGTAGRSGRQPVLPRRAVLRQVVSGALNRAADLGPVRLEREKDQIRVKPPDSGYFDLGFSLLIKAPGFYTLKGSAFPCVPPGGLVFEASGPAMQKAGTLGKRGFFARFPLVLRTWQGEDFILKAGQKRRLSDILKIREKALPEYGGSITAQDPEGCAAFIVIRNRGQEGFPPNSAFGEASKVCPAASNFHVLLLCRDGVKEAAVFVAVSAESSIEISGGIDV
jgi:hypothetical protein